MDQQLTNCWLSASGKIRSIFKSNHFFETMEKSVCGQCKIWPDDEKYIKPMKFKDIFLRKVCKRCVQVCEMKGIDYKK